MGELQVHAFSVSVDGYAAGPLRSPETPLGVGGELLHEWPFAADPAPADTAAPGRRPRRGGAGGEEPPLRHDVFVQHRDDAAGR